MSLFSLLAPKFPKTGIKIKIKKTQNKTHTHTQKKKHHTKKTPELKSKDLVAPEKDPAKVSAGRKFPLK